MAWQILEGKGFFGRPSVDFQSSECSLKQSLEIVERWTPVEAEIDLADWPASSMVSIVFFCAGERDRMMMVVGKKEVCELF